MIYQLRTHEKKENFASNTTVSAITPTCSNDYTISDKNTKCYKQYVRQNLCANGLWIKNLVHHIIVLNLKKQLKIYVQLVIISIVFNRTCWKGRKICYK